LFAGGVKGAVKLSSSAMLPGLNPAVSECKPYSWKIAGEGRKCGCESVETKVGASANGKGVKRGKE